MILQGLPFSGHEYAVLNILWPCIYIHTVHELRKKTNGRYINFNTEIYDKAVLSLKLDAESHTGRGEIKRNGPRNCSKSTVCTKGI